MRFRTEFALIGLRYERGHQLAISNRPGARSAHCLMCNRRHRVAVEIRAVLDQLDDIEHRLARDRSNEGEKDLRTEAMAAIEDLQPHAHSFPAASRAVSPASYCRVACPTAPHTTISKIWSSLRPDFRAAAMSSSVTLEACLATLST